MLYLACIMVSSVDLAQYGVSRAKDWVSVDCGTDDFKVVLPAHGCSVRPRALSPNLSAALQPLVAIFFAFTVLC